MAVARPANRVARAIHPRPVGSERIGDKAFGSQVTATEIAACQSCSGEVQLTVDAVGNRHECGVEDVGSRSVDGSADHRMLGVGRACDESVDRRLGGSVQVVGVGAGEFAIALPLCVRNRFATETDGAHGFFGTVELTQV